ncbi:class I SAM-dependent methyltransferase [Mycolicibacterium novocastrense]|uniref:Class I SAM-dependent methyltransferase n=1 Tax=Mycolicibacterium novocastrense TaxID=59813 RepID=A0AAW5SL80_MYCNV|nr:class I SAM-dependent methyltransferase [Mycolicibacterium novocastrense]MCV7024407.1 class I SAM-dependent methyltransferase [Mycolicibacterium novocastrense]GAT12935.1 methyltransferase domain protein [Mycolicibacterium novocastrense]
MTDDTSAWTDFDALYRDEGTVDGLPPLTPWDIGGPQPAVQLLVAYGAVRGRVLDPGTGPGHNAILYASKGFQVTGIDVSPAAIDRAKLNADRAGVDVDFRVGDITALDGLDERFDTVVDSAVYHVFADDESAQSSYAAALHRVTNPGARLYMFEFGQFNLNGVPGEGLPADNFDRVLAPAGWRIDHLGTTSFQHHFTAEAFAHVPDAPSGPYGERLQRVRKRLGVIEPLLENNVLHWPVWAVVATRID